MNGRFTPSLYARFCNVTNNCCARCEPCRRITSAKDSSHSRVSSGSISTYSSGSTDKCFNMKRLCFLVPLGFGETTHLPDNSFLRLPSPPSLDRATRKGHRLAIVRARIAEFIFNPAVVSVPVSEKCEKKRSRLRLAR